MPSASPDPRSASRSDPASVHSKVCTQPGCTYPLRVKSASYSLSALLNVSANGFQSQMFWGLISQVLALKAGLLHVEYKTLLLRGLRVLSSLPTVGHNTRAGVYGETVSQPFLPALVCSPSCLPNVKRSMNQFLVFFRENCSTCSCGRRWFRISLCCHLELEPPRNEMCLE